MSGKTTISSNLNKTSVMLDKEGKPREKPARKERVTKQIKSFNANLKQI